MHPNLTKKTHKIPSGILNVPEGRFTTEQVTHQQYIQLVKSIREGVCVEGKTYGQHYQSHLSHTIAPTKPREWFKELEQLGHVVWAGPWKSRLILADIDQSQNFRVDHVIRGYEERAERVLRANKKRHRRRKTSP